MRQAAAGEVPERVDPDLTAEDKCQGLTLKKEGLPEGHIFRFILFPQVSSVIFQLCPPDFPYPDVFILPFLHKTGPRPGWILAV